MEKFIPYEKLSKKEKRRRDAMRRGYLGRAESSHPQERKPQSLQPSEGTKVV